MIEGFPEYLDFGLIQFLRIRDPDLSTGDNVITRSIISSSVIICRMKPCDISTHESICLRFVLEAGPFL